MPRRFLYFFLIILGGSVTKLFAQPAWTLDPFGQEKKPTQFVEKKLGSEKTADKKFTPFRRFTQNSISHYNYYFNANAKLNGVLERARMAQQEDYTKLLPFYPYSLETTSGEKVELDSVIYKATAGILLHDLRSDWVDDLYFLIGKAFYYRKEFDSAAMTFQFINYNLYPRKKGEDDGRVVGGNSLTPGSMLSISDPEKRTFLQRLFSKAPCRNDALVWLGKAFTDGGLYGDAAGMINILQQDFNLPKRLRGKLHEANSYWFYNQQIYDSAAVYLEKALPSAPTAQDRARWQYLIAQMYEMSNSYDKASYYYLKSAKKTIDPLLDIHAHLNDAKLAAGKGDMSQVGDNISRLIKMAKKDKYAAYRDIIYYSAGELAVKIPDTATAAQYFTKSLKYNEDNPAYRNMAFVQLGNMAYESRNYYAAANFYDSLDMEDPAIVEDTVYINERKAVLGRITSLMDIIRQEDSLQQIAAMSPADRDAFIKKLSKKLRAESGEKEETIVDTRGNIQFSNQNSQPVDMFGTSAKGEWYFYNTALRTRGFNEFQGKWGKRANIDNWRRSNATNSTLSNISANIDVDAPATDDSSAGGSTGLIPGSYDALMANVPLSAEKKDSSNARIAGALVNLSSLFRDELQDYAEAIHYYEEYLSRFKGSSLDGEVYTGLFFCYTKLGDAAMVEKYKKLVVENFAGSKYANAVLNPRSTKGGEKDSRESAQYQAIYDLFVSGRFDEALAAKREADSLMGNSYWTPQLLYLEAVYYVKERNDSAAIRVLDDIISLYPGSSLVEKAETLKDVVSRRAEIESYLTDLDVTRLPEDKKVPTPDNNRTAAPVNRNPANPANTAIPTPVPTPSAKDSSRSLTPTGFLIRQEQPHMVMMVMDKVDAVYVTEVKNAMLRFNRDKYPSKGVAVNKEMLDANRSLILFDILEDANAAMGYCDNLKKSSAAYISWLQPSKYYFLIISKDNFQALKSGGDINAYKAALNAVFPNKF